MKRVKYKKNSKDRAVKDWRWWFTTDASQPPLSYLTLTYYCCRVKTGKQTNRKNKKYTQRQTTKQTNIQKDKQTNRKDKQRDRWIDKERDKTDTKKDK